MVGKDMKAAFLNSDPTELERKIHGEPQVMFTRNWACTPKMFLASESCVECSPTRVVNVAWRTSEFRSKQRTLDNCVWRMFEGNRPVGVLRVRFDVVVCAANGKRYDEVVRKLKNVSPFGLWKWMIEKCHAWAATRSPKKCCFWLSLNEINLTQERKQQPDEETTPTEKKRCGGYYRRSLAWRATRHLGFGRQLQICKVRKRRRGFKICCPWINFVDYNGPIVNTVCVFPPNSGARMILAVSDASHANLSDLSSEGGTLTVLTDK